MHTSIIKENEKLLTFLDFGGMQDGGSRAGAGWTLAGDDDLHAADRLLSTATGFTAAVHRLRRTLHKEEFKKSVAQQITTFFSSLTEQFSQQCFFCCKYILHSIQYS